MNRNIWPVTKRSYAVVRCRLCYRCERRFKIGDMAVSHGSSGPRNKYYHLECWESLFVDA